MRIVFIAAECEPFAKTGGLGDVVDALARALGRIVDTPVEVFLPLYRTVQLPAGEHDRLTLRVPEPSSPAGAISVDIVEVAADGYRLRLVDLPRAFDRDAFYGDPTGDYPDNAWRFGMFCRAALEALRADAVGPDGGAGPGADVGAVGPDGAEDSRAVDIVHLHDWHAAPAAILRDRFYAADPVIGRAAMVMTMHNLAYHGWVAPARIGELGLAPGDGIVALAADGIDLLREGVERAEVANTVSPGYAGEALTPEYGMGLQDVLARKARLHTPDGSPRFTGILNGLDNGLWNPATDPVLAANYGVGGMEGKAACRADLLERMGLDPADPGPVLGMIGRLDPQKGFDILAAAAPALLERGARIVVQGSGDTRLVESLRRLAVAHPRSIAIVERFDRALARRIYAGADLYVMPSRFEPCGQGQMIALRYGAPPVVRRTGGLGDTVVDEGERPGHGTGFVFDEATPTALLAACERAFALRRPAGTGAGTAATAATAPDWQALVARGMAVDFSWESGPAHGYLAAYRGAIELRRAIELWREIGPGGPSNR